LHTPTKAKDEVESRFLLNVVIRESAAVFELLFNENQALLGGRDALLVLDLGLDVVNGVRRFYLEGDCLSGQGLDENLHTSAKAKDEVKGRLLLNVCNPREFDHLQAASQRRYDAMMLPARREDLRFLGRDGGVATDALQYRGREG